MIPGFRRGLRPASAVLLIELEAKNQAWSHMLGFFGLLNSFFEKIFWVIEGVWGWICC